MQTITASAPAAKKLLWAGRIIGVVVILLLLSDSIIKGTQLDVAVKTTAQLAYPGNVVFGLGVLALVIAVLYAIPRTSVLEAILLAGLLGGAMATHLRVGSPLFICSSASISAPHGLMQPVPA